MNELSSEDILRILPHRYPFVLIDKVVQCTLNKQLTAIKNVTYNEPFFQGHFPDKPVMPGVLMVEAMAQAAGVLALKSVHGSHESALFFFAGIDKARFKKIVVPGDQLHIQVDVLRARSDIWKLEGQICVDEQVACVATIMIARSKKHDAPQSNH